MKSIVWRQALMLLGAYLLATALGYAISDQYARGWLPLLGAEIDWILPDGFERTSLRLTRNAGQRLIVLSATTSRALTVGGEYIPAHTELQSATLQMYALHHLVIVFALLASWPASSISQRIRLLVLGIPCVLATTSLDIPFVLVGLTHDNLLESIAPEKLATDPLSVYYAFLHRGGRLGLAVAGALIVALGAGNSAMSDRKETKSS
jgi:hypothetical protein